jgi:hypothetical protein
MLFRVTDLNTDIAYQQTFNVNVQTRMGQGWLALTEREDGFNIDMLNLYRDTITVYRDLLDLVGSTLPRTGETPMSIFSFQNFSSRTPLFRDNRNISIMVHTDRELSILSADDYSYDPDVNLTQFTVRSAPDFQNGFKPTKLIPMVQTHNRSRMYAYFNESFYIYNIAPMFSFWRPVNRIRGGDGTILKVAPYIAGSNQNGVLLFDTDNKRFIYHAAPSAMDIVSGVPDSETLLTSLVISDTPDAHFSFNNDIESLVFMETYAANFGFAIIKDASLGKYRLFEFNTVLNRANTRFAGTFDDNAFIESIKFFARTPDNANAYLYMATEDKVYRILVNTATMNTIEDITPSVLRPGYKISTFRFLPSNGGGTAMENYLTIGSYNPSGQVGENGLIEMYNFEAGTGNLIIRKQPNNEPSADGYQIEMRFPGAGDPPIGKPIDISRRGLW